MSLQSTRRSFNHCGSESATGELTTKESSLAGVGGISRLGLKHFRRREEASTQGTVLGCVSCCYYYYYHYYYSVRCYACLPIPTFQEMATQAIESGNKAEAKANAQFFAGCGKKGFLMYMLAHTTVPRGC